MADPKIDAELPKDDRDWIELLRGREAPGADAATLAEARLVRASLRAARSSAVPDTDNGLQPLLFRLKREGLLDAPPARRLRPAYLAVAAALIAAIAAPLMLQIQQAEEPEPYRTRSLTVPTVTVHAADPASRAGDIADALRAAGATVETSEREGRARLTITVPPEKRESIRNTLIQLKIDADPTRRLAIDVVPANE